MTSDIKYALRAFLSTPGFTLAAVLSLAIGIGANTAIFSVANALLLRALPYRDADRLVILWNRSPGLGITEDWFSTAQYFDIRSGHHGFDDVAIAIGANANLTGDGQPQRIGTIQMSSNLLPLLGVQARLGRLFTAAEDVQGGPATAILGHGTWQRRFGGDPAVIGRKLTLNGQPYEIVGVLPASFTLPRDVMPTLGGAEDAEVVLPLPMRPDAATFRGREDYNLVGRLKHGVTIQAAQSEMDVLTARLRAEHPDVYPPNGGLTFGIVPLREQVVGDVRTAVLLLTGAVAFVLLIACANVANLLLARAVGRQRELAIRAAVGASASRLVRQLLVESALLAIAGGIVGLLLSSWSLAGLRALGARSVPRAGEVTIDTRVLLFTVAVSLLSGMLFGLAPALRLRRLDVHAQLKDAGRGATGGSAWGERRNPRRLLVAGELALSVVLLAGAGLLIRSFAQLQQVPAGFSASNVLTLEVTLNGPRYANGQRVGDAYRDLIARLERIPGVRGAAVISALPLSQMFSWGPVTIEGRVPPPGERFVNVDERMIGPGYFAAMQIPMLDGRDFDDHDLLSGARVAVVDDYMAEQMWPGQRAVGRRLHTGGADAKSPWITVVGVVGRIKQYALDADSRIAMYLPHAQFPVRAMNVVIRTEGDPATAVAPVRAAIRAFDPELPVYNVRSMADRVAESLARRRFAMLLLALFAAIALGLAAIGVYGVIAYLVSQGTRELGIRLALGATPRGILLMIVGHGMAVAAAGVLAGVLAALALTRFVRSLLFGVSPLDPLTFLCVAGLLAIVALAATALPARRAARIDPIVSLRSE